MPKTKGEMRLSIEHHNLHFKTQEMAFKNCVEVEKLTSFRANVNSKKIFLTILQFNMFKTLEWPRNFFNLPLVNFNDNPIVISSGANMDIIRDKSTNFSQSTSKISKIGNDLNPYTALTYLPFFMKCGKLGTLVNTYNTTLMSIQRSTNYKATTQ